MPYPWNVDAVLEFQFPLRWERCFYNRTVTYAAIPPTKFQFPLRWERCFYRFRKSLIINMLL